MAPSIFEAVARGFVIKCLSNFISHGSLLLVEDGRSIITFEGDTKRCGLKIVLRIHNSQFYWKVMTRADIGLADAYVDGDFSLEDENLLDLFLVLIANRDANRYSSNLVKKRNWWMPITITSGFTCTRLLLQQYFRRNSLTQARRNISHHYDLSNEIFELFLGETMTYSCGIFKTKNEDLNTAQLRKISSLIEKARIEKDHEVLDIGCGWGTFAIEVVKQTGCKYTGITLSTEQLKYAEAKVKDAGFQDFINLLLCDYRELKGINKYNRIISCEMIEHVGHEYMEEFFGCCESLLAEDGLFVLQSASVPDHCYDEYRNSPNFLKEYIFPGGCYPSLSRIMSAVATASKLSVEHVENIGSHYHTTLVHWRNNFLENKSKILGMGYNEKFIRTWEYYFDYVAAGFKSYVLGNYQVVFSRPSNYAALGDPYIGFRSTNQLP